MESGRSLEYTIPKLAQSVRLDKWLLDEGPNSSAAGQRILSRTQIVKLIDNGSIRVNGSAVKKSYKAKTGDKIVIILPEAKPEKVEILPADAPLRILFQDNHLAVIYKDPGVAVHRGEGEATEDVFLVNILKHHFGDSLSLKGGEERPGIVHRLDKDTSGAMIVCKTDDGWTGVHEMLKERRDISKEYHCVVLGRFKEKSGSITSRIGRHPKQGHKMITSDDPAFGKDAHTDYNVLEEFKIRVHMASIQHPIVGDNLYSTKHGRFALPHLLLVSKTLKFTHPISKQELSFDVDYPPHFDKFLMDLKAQKNDEEAT